MKTFDEIINEIRNLQTSEIEQYVIDRLKVLEDETEELTIGQGYGDSYSGYIGLKSHYKPMASNKVIKCPDLVYDDIRPYIKLVKSIKEGSTNQVLVMNDVFYVINDFSNLSDNFELSRGFTYFSAMQSNRRVSIKNIFDNSCAFCSERSGLAQNMFKFLAIDSELVIGYYNNEPHAYNLIYPRGYGVEPIFLFDASHFVSFKSDEHYYSLGYFYGMNLIKYNELKLGKQYQIDLSKTENYYRKVYGFDGSYEFVAEEPKYTFGLANNPQIVQERINDEWLYSAHYENGVETDIRSNSL